MVALVGGACWWRLLVALVGPVDGGGAVARSRPRVRFGSATKTFQEDVPRGGPAVSVCPGETAGHPHSQPNSCYGCFLPDLTGFTGSQTRAGPCGHPWTHGSRKYSRVGPGSTRPASTRRELCTWAGCRVPRAGPARARGLLAERVGFEPTEGLHLHLISNQARSTGLRHLSRFVSP